MQMQYLENILKRIGALPEVQTWPILKELIPRGRSLDWYIPLSVTESFDRPPDQALPASAALACLQVSILLVDDMLDNDPRGAFRDIGSGRTANIALALQACANRLIADAGLPPAAEAAAQKQIADIALHTAYGQQLDSENLRGEENYWKVVRAKSTPFYAGAYALGATFAGATKVQLTQFVQLGHLAGELIQIADDIDDALDPVLNADWGEERNNLLIMFAELADHPARQAFLQLRQNIHMPDALAQAQQILIESGALSYAIYLAAQRLVEIETTLGEISLPDPKPMEAHIATHEASFQPYAELAGLSSIKDLSD